MYVDESGDCGTINSPTKHFILTALVVNEIHWKRLIDEAISFRREVRKKGLLMKEEIHASAFVTKRIKLRNSIPRSIRVQILKDCIDWLSSRDYVSLFSVRIDKSKHGDPFTKAWTLILQRFENTLKHQNFPYPAFKKENGIIISDDTDTKKLTGLVRKMRKINYVPNMTYFGGGSTNMPVELIVKDPIFRGSDNSYILQFVDVAAYFAKQYYAPSKYIKRKGLKNYYGKLAPILNQKVTYSTKSFKIIEL